MKRKLGFLAVSLAALLFPGSTASWGVVSIERVSVTPAGSQANNQSRLASVNSDGRYLVFISFASDLVPGDTNGFPDIFLRDRQLGQTTRVSVASDGTEANGPSGLNQVGDWGISISADGRYIAFASGASNLVPDDTNNYWDIFVHDRQTGHTERVSVGSDGSQANGPSMRPSISADGHYVSFASSASNLVPGDTNNTGDIFVRDRLTGQTSRVSVASDGAQASSGQWVNSISGGGRWVAFDSDAPNLVPGDTNGATDVFVHDRQTGQTTRVSVASDGFQANGYSESPGISADGRYVTFTSSAPNLVPSDTNFQRDIFVHDRETGQTTRVSVSSDGAQANSFSWASSISLDGRYVAFTSVATNLVPGDTSTRWDIFVHDRQTGQTTRASVAADGSEGNGKSVFPSLGLGGQYVAFESEASNLTPSDKGGWDIFVAVLGTPSPPPPIDVSNMDCQPKLMNLGFTICGFILNRQAWAALIVLNLFGSPVYTSSVDLNHPFPVGPNSISWIGQLNASAFASGPYIPIIYAADADGHSDYALDPAIYVMADNGANPTVSNLTVTPATGSYTIGFDVDKYHGAIVGIVNSSGAWVRLLTDDAAYAGHESFVWDKRDAGGNIVPPGSYWFISAAIDYFGRGSACYTSSAVSAESCFTFTANSWRATINGDIPQAIREAIPKLLAEAALPKP